MSSYKWPSVSSGGGGGITIGDAITGGTANRVLYQDAGNVLAESAAFQFSGAGVVIGATATATANFQLDVRNSGGDSTIHITNASSGHLIGDGSIISYTTGLNLVISNRENGDILIGSSTPLQINTSGGLSAVQTKGVWPGTGGTRYSIGTPGAAGVTSLWPYLSGYFDFLAMGYVGGDAQPTVAAGKLKVKTGTPLILEADSVRTATGVVIGSAASAPNYGLDLRATAAAAAVFCQFTIPTTTGTLSTDGTRVGLDAAGNFIIDQQEASLDVIVNGTGNLVANTDGILVNAPSSGGIVLTTADATYAFLGLSNSASVAGGAEFTLQATNELDVLNYENQPIRFFTNSIENGSVQAAGDWVLGPGAGGVTHRLNTNTTAPNADALTLLNGPTGTAGNPDTYLTININGVDHVIPAWIP